jgi:MoaA/NifB/PqqE/SkfB family radical SAM enzyme
LPSIYALYRLTYKTLKKNKLILPKHIVKDFNRSRSAENRNKAVCLAPFKSLRFLPDGHITVCCHNNSWYVGKYPETHILEAWQSPAIKQLRTKLAKSDFSLGCYECLPAFENQDFSSVNPLLYENYPANTAYPVMLDFKIATTCNMQCVMCSEYSSSAKRLNQTDHSNTHDVYQTEFVEELLPLIPHLAEARFSGGEPFLNEIYYRIWEHIIQINRACKIMVQTNGSILTNKIKNLLADGNFHINISMDAANAGLYESIRVNGNYQKVMENLEYFSGYSKNKDIPLGITACTMQNNAYNLYEIMLLANRYHARLWYSDVYFPFRNALWVLPAEKIHAIVQHLKSQTLNPQNCIEHHNGAVFKDMIKRLEYWNKQASEREDRGTAYINAHTLENLLEDIFRHLIHDNPQPWQNISTALESIQNKDILNFTDVVKNYGKADFIYDRLGSMSITRLSKEFEKLLK